MSIKERLYRLSRMGRGQMYKELKEIGDIRGFCTMIVNADDPLSELLTPIRGIVRKLLRLQEESSQQGFATSKVLENWVSAFRSVDDELRQLGMQRDMHTIEQHLVIPFILSDESDILRCLRDTIPRLELATSSTTFAEDKPDFDGIAFPRVRELIQQLSQIGIGRVVDTAKVGDEIRSDLMLYIMTRIYENERKVQRYQVAGLFYDENQDYGLVQNVRVTLSEASPDDHEPEPTYGFKVKENEDGMELKRSVGKAVRAVSNLLGTALNVRVDIEEEKEQRYHGESLGLAVAAAMLANSTGQVIGIEAAGDVAITGSISSASGNVGEVDRIKEKSEAIIKSNKLPYTRRKVSHIVVPEGNAGEVPQELGLTVHKVKHIEDLLRMLFDPWRDYLDTFSITPKPLMPEEAQAEVTNPDNNRLCIFKRFAESAADTADGIARHLAQKRLGSLKISGDHPPIPVRLDVGLFRRDSRLADMVSERITMQCEQVGISAVDGIYRALRNGQMALIFHGLDTYNELDFFKPGAAMKADIESYYYRNQLVFVCNESSWHRHCDGIRDLDVYKPLKLYDGRSTFLDDHIRKIMEQRAPNLILPCRTAKVELTAFFQGTERQGHYLELRVQKLNREDGRHQEIRSLGDVIRADQDRHILLVGDGGSGKTTALLKLMFDYTEKQLTSEEGVLIIPMFIHAEELAEKRSIPNLVWEISSDKVDRELRDTRDILIMIDGLNEVKLENEGYFLSAIRRLVEDHPQHRVILTSRRQEYARAEAILSKDIIQDNFEQYELLAPDFSDARSYLAAVMRPELAEQVMTALGSQTSVIANPMVVYLMSTIPNELEDQVAEGRKLARGWIYKTAVDRWLQRESESSKASLRIEAIHGFLRYFAHKMIGSQRSRLSEEEAIEIIDDLYRRDPRPHWYPYDRKREIYLHPTEVYDRLITCPLFRVSA